LREKFFKDAITISDFSDHVFIWDKTILKNQFSIVGEAFTHLVVHMADGKTISVSLKQEASAAFSQSDAFFSLYEQKVETSPVAIRDKMLHAVHNPSSLGFFSRSSKGGRIRKEIIRGIIWLCDADSEAAPGIFNKLR